MHRWLGAGMLLPVLCLAQGEPGPDARAARDLAKFGTRMEAMRRGLGIPGMSAAISKGQRVVWAQGFGRADAERDIPAADSTAYHLASLTKTFASTIVMQLVQESRLDLEAPVAEFGIAIESQGVVRVKHLLTHTSEGIPGSSYRYNGDRFGQLDRVILRATGESFGQRLHRFILAPLRLRHTAPNPLALSDFALAGLDRAAFERNLAQGYGPDGTARVAYPRHFGTAAGLVGSALDVARYSMAIDRNAFLSAETQARVFSPTISLSGQTLPYGLGWFIQTVRGVRLQWHYGYWTGNSSLIIRVPQRGLTFVLLANSDRLSRDTSLGAGDLLSSKAARLFLDTFVFGRARLPD
jgi:CubicO group peptidase (beta-lactamase class C family)